MSALAEVAPGTARMTDNEMARALGVCTNALPTVRAEHPTPLPELRDQLRAAARAIMQMWADLEDDEMFGRFAARHERELTERMEREARLLRRAKLEGAL